MEWENPRQLHYLNLMEPLLTVWTDLELDIRVPDHPIMKMARDTILALHDVAARHAALNAPGIANANITVTDG